MDLQLARSRVLVIDVPTASRLELTGVEGRGTWARDSVMIENLTGMLNGGHLELTARLERGVPSPAFEGEVRIENAGIGGSLGLLGLLVPALAGPSQVTDLEGQLELDVRLHGRGADGETIRSSLAGEGSIDLHDVALDQTPLFAEVSRAFHLSAADRVGSLQGNYVIVDRRVATRDLTLHAGSLPIRMVGWTDFAGRFDYLLRTDQLAARAALLTRRLPPEYREPLADLPAALDRVTQLHLQGGPRGLQITADGVDLDDWARRASDPKSREFQKLRELGRRLRSHDRLFR